MNIPSAYIVEELNRIVGLNALDLYSVKKIENIVRTYRIDKKSFQKLQDILNFDKSEREECGCKWEGDE